MKKLTGGLDDYSLRACGYDKEKILKAVSECVSAMGDLTIAESLIARKHLDSVMEKCINAVQIQNKYYSE